MRAQSKGMRPSITLSLCLTSLCFSALASSAAAGPFQDPGDAEGGPPPFEAPALCPAPLQVEPRWAPLTVTAEGRVVFAEAHLEGLAKALARDLAALTGLSLPVAPAPGRSGDFILSEGYLPQELTGNPEAFFVEVLDHVLISGQTADGAARACARVLQLCQPELTEGALTGISMPAVRIVDAPSMRWRIQSVEVAPLLAALAPDAEPSARAAALAVVRRAHVCGFNALLLRDGPRGVAGHADSAAVARLLGAECEQRRITLVLPGALTGAAGLRWAAATPDTAQLQAARSGSFQWLCDSDPFPQPSALAALGAAAADEGSALQLLERCVHPIPATAASPTSQPLAGRLYGHRTALAGDTLLPVGWLAPADQAGAWPALAAEAWHAGRRFDDLRGSAALERALQAAAR